MGYEEIDFEIREAIAIITLDRPDRLNAFTGTMGRELGSAYRRCDRDDRVRAVVVTGAGRAFCAGADLGGGGATFERRDEAGFSAAGVDPPAWAVRKPVIAAVNGHAVGIGLTLADGTLGCAGRGHGLPGAPPAALGVERQRRLAGLARRPRGAGRIGLVKGAPHHGRSCTTSRSRVSRERRRLGALRWAPAHRARARGCRRCPPGGERS